VGLQAITGEDHPDLAEVLDDGVEFVEEIIVGSNQPEQNPINLNILQCNASTNKTFL